MNHCSVFLLSGLVKKEKPCGLYKRASDLWYTEHKDNNLNRILVVMNEVLELFAKLPDKSGGKLGGIPGEDDYC